VLSQLTPADYVMVQFGHNDQSTLDTRGTLAGTGEEFQAVVSTTTMLSVDVHTYGFYLRQYADDIRPTGAHLIGFAGAGKLIRFLVFLAKSGPQETDERNVESVQPDDRSIAVVAVVVPGPRGRHDEIAAQHFSANAVNRRIAARAFEHEAQRRLAMTMCPRYLTRKNQLEAGIDRIGRIRQTFQPGIHQHQNAPLRFFRAHHSAGFD